MKSDLPVSPSHRAATIRSLLLLFALVLLIVPAHAANIRFIVLSTPLEAGDVALQNLMQGMGHTVNLRAAYYSTPADADGNDLIVISPTVWSGEVGTKFRDVTKPVLIMKSTLFDDMGMVGTQFDQVGSLLQGQILIQNSGHSLAAGLTGSVQVYSPDEELNWGIPAASAIRVASLVSNANRLPIFAYNTGAAMVGMNAPARRLAFLFRENGPVRATEAANSLFRAAVNWSLGMDAPPPVAPAITVQPVPASVVAGQTATFVVTATGTPAPAYQWYRTGIAISGATSASYTTPATAPQDDAVEFFVTVTNSAGAVTSEPAAIEVRYAPIIGDQPDDVTVDVGEVAVFTASAIGNPLPTSWQWRRNGVNIPNPGPNPESYVIPSVSAADQGAVFSVIVGNATGSTASAGAVLSVFTAPTITAQPAGTTVDAGQTATFAVATTGNPSPSFQWQRNGVNISGATSAGYTTPVTAPADDFAQFRVLVSNSRGTVTSGQAVLRVQYAPSLANSQVNHMLYAGQTITFTALVQGNPTPTLQWVKNSGNIAGATGINYTTPPLTSFDNNAFFRVVATNSMGTASANVSSLVVYYAPIITSMSDSAYAVVGQTASFHVGANGNMPPSYQWRRNGVNLPGGTSATYTTPPNVAGDDGALYSVVLTNQVGSVTSQNAYLSVRHAPIILSGPASASIMEGQSHTFSISVKTNPAATYFWLKNGVLISGAGASTYTVPPASLSESGAAYQVMVENFLGGVMSGNATLTVTPMLAAPAITSHPTDVLVNPGERAAFTVTATGIPAPTFQWRRNGTNISGATAASYTTDPAQRFGDSGAAYTVVATNSQGNAVGGPAILRVEQMANRQLVTITGELMDSSGMNPIGMGGPMNFDVTVYLFAVPTGGTPLYMEQFTYATGGEVPVFRGLFTVRLGTGYTQQNLADVVSGNSNLFAEIWIGPANAQERIEPRTPITAPMFAGTPKVARGVIDPSLKDVVGAFYENTATGTTWIRMPTNWVRISP